MGTNYYMEIENKELHLGKSSAGWAFMLRVYPKRGILDLSDYCRLFASQDVSLHDEYGEQIHESYWISIILNRRLDTGSTLYRDRKARATPEYLEREYARFDEPTGLLFSLSDRDGELAPPIRWMTKFVTWQRRTGDFR